MNQNRDNYIAILSILFILVIAYGSEYDKFNRYVKSHVNNTITLCDVNNCHYLGIVKYNSGNSRNRKINIRYIIGCDFTTIFLDQKNTTIENVEVGRLKDQNLINNTILTFNNTQQKCYVYQNTITYKNPNNRDVDGDIKRRKESLNNLIIVCSIAGFLIILPILLIIFNKCQKLNTKKIIPNENGIPLTYIDV